MGEPFLMPHRIPSRRRFISAEELRDLQEIAWDPRDWVPFRKRGRRSRVRVLEDAGLLVLNARAGLAMLTALGRSVVEGTHQNR